MQLEPAEVIKVRGEVAELSASPPASYGPGTRLEHGRTAWNDGVIPVPGSIDPASIVVSHDGRRLELGTDYLLDPGWGVLGVGPSGRVTPHDKVEVDYDASVLRIDSLVRTPTGGLEVIRGRSHITTPTEPETASGELIANFFVGYFATAEQIVVLPFIEAWQPEFSRSTAPAGSLDRSITRLRDDKRLRVVSWGDSISAGGDATAPEFAFPGRVAEGLRGLFPEATIEFKVVAEGGSKSVNWLYPDEMGHPWRREMCDWRLVEETRPDLAIIEFTNDAMLPPNVWPRAYDDITARCAALGADVILVTPSWFGESVGGFGPCDGHDDRPYTHWLLKYASKNGIAVGDASYRLAHLRAEALPWITFIANGINHPDDRGHALIAGEILRCFERALGRD